MWDSGGPRFGAGEGPSQELPNLDLSKVPFTNGVTIYNRSKRFVIPIKAMPGGGEPLTIPPGQPDAGRVIYTDEKAGVRFVEEGENAGQLSISDGQEIVLISGLTKAQAGGIESRIRALSEDPVKISYDRMIQIFKINQSSLALDPKQVESRAVKPQRGLVFYNYTDHTWQGVQGNGLEAIVINNITPEQAESLYKKIDEINSDPSKLTSRQIRAVLQYARLELGIIDYFDKDRESIQAEMGLVEPSARRYDSDDNEITTFGYMEVTKPTGHSALYIYQPFMIQDGPRPQRYPNGGVVVSDGRNSWGVASDVIERNWVVKNDNGDEVAVCSVAKELPHYAISAYGNESA